MYKLTAITIASSILIAIVQLSAYAQDNHTISHQGMLTDEAGEPVEDDSYIFTFRIYDDETDGEELWSESQVLQVSDGVFNAQLGAEEPLDLPFDEPYWIGVEIDGEDELEPRMPLSATPYAMHALTVRDGSITTDKIGDGAVTMAKLAATSDVESVDLGLHMGLETDPENLGSITIEAPSSGSVLLFLSGTAIFFGENTTMSIGLGTSETLFDIYKLSNFGTLDGSGEKRYRLTFNPMAAVEVEEGTHTFYATALKEFDSHSINLDSLQFIAVYLPE